MKTVAYYLTSVLAAATAIAAAPLSVYEGQHAKHDAHQDLSPKRELFGIETIPSFNGRTQYVYIYGPNHRSRSEAIATCKAIRGGHLADVPSIDVLRYLTKYVKKNPAYINSWQGDNYQGASIALYPGGAISITNPCSADFICEVPLSCPDSSSTSCTSSDETSSCWTTDSYTCTTTPSESTCTSSTWTDPCTTTTSTDPCCSSSTDSCDWSTSSSDSCTTSGDSSLFTFSTSDDCYTSSSSSSSDGCSETTTTTACTTPTTWSFSFPCTSSSSSDSTSSCPSSSSSSSCSSSSSSSSCSDFAFGYKREQVLNSPAKKPRDSLSRLRRELNERYDPCASTTTDHCSSSSSSDSCSSSSSSDSCSSSSESSNPCDSSSTSESCTSSSSSCTDTTTSCTSSSTCDPYLLMAYNAELCPASSSNCFTDFAYA